MKSLAHVVVALLVSTGGLMEPLQAQEAPREAILEEPAITTPGRPDPEPAREETPAERDRRLIEKHLPPLDRNLLNRITLPLVGEPKAVRARRLERESEIREFRTRMDAVLNGLRKTDSAEYRRVRDAYHDTLYRLYRELRGD